MLTKELILCRSSGNRIFPKFIDARSGDHLELAAQMLAVLEEGGFGQTRGEILAQLDQIAAGSLNAKVAAGFRKLLEDRMEFSPPLDVPFAEERRKIFLAAAALLRDGRIEREDSFRQEVRRQAKSPLLDEENRLYGDLPDNDRFLSVHGMTPPELLERYNCGLVQALLLQSRRIELELDGVSTAALRQLLTALRFRRLACDVMEVAPKSIENAAKCGENQENNEKRVSAKIVVEGPASILNQSRSYGLQLALFFPAVCVMPRWRLRAEILWKEHWRLLLLDEHSHVTSRSHHAGYEPEEFGVFRRRFAEQLTVWRLLDEASILKSPDGTLVVPDFTLARDGGSGLFHVELFHRWHASALLGRLKQLSDGRFPNLVIGVDKAIASRPDVEEALAQSAAFAVRGFLYRDFPVVDKLLKVLDSLK